MKVKLILYLLSSLFFLIFVSFIGIYSSDTIYKRALIESEASSLVKKAIDKADSIVNELNFIRILKRQTLREDQYVRLFLSGSDVKQIKDQSEMFIDLGFIKDELNPWRKAKIGLEGKKQNIKFKFHGTSVSPLRRNSFSLRVKHKKEDDYLDFMREFSLITYKDELDISTIGLNKVANDLGLIAPYGKLSILKINGVSIGIYMLVEHHDDEWFEKNFGITNYSLLKSYDDWDRKETLSGMAHISDSDLMVENKEVSGTSAHHDIALGALDRLMEAIELEDIKTIRALVDIDYAANFMAMSALVNDNHPIAGDNFRYIYDFTRGNFKFLFRVEGSAHSISTKIMEFNLSWFNTNIFKSKTHQLFKLLLREADIRTKRDFFLVRLIRSKQKILESIQEIYEENYSVILSSNIPLRREYINKTIFFEKINHNFTMIENYLNYNKVFVTLEEDDDGNRKIRILNDSYVPISLEQIIFQTEPDSSESFLDLNLNYPAHNLDKDLLLILKKNEYNLENALPIKSFVFRNGITKGLIKQKDIYLNSLKVINYLDREETINSLKKNKILYSLESDLLTIFPGVYEIKENLIVDSSIKTKVTAGTKFLVSKNKSLLFQGDFDAIGTKKNPITINQLNQGEPFGSLAIIGRVIPIKVNLEHFFIDGGSETILQGVEFTGQLSIHYADVSLRNIQVTNSYSDDGMNIRNGNIRIVDSIFKENIADQVDLDFCEGTIEGSVFQAGFSQVEINGDGLDLSGSKVELRNNNFSGFKDKGLSVGENSLVLINSNKFTSNNHAIAIKDQSVAFSLSNEFINNSYQYNLYIKKPFFSYPILKTNVIPDVDKINLLEGKIIKLKEKNIINEYRSF